MTIDEPHDHRRHLSDKNHAHGMPDKRSKDHESAPNPAMFKRHTGPTDEDRKTAADWREKQWKNTKRAGPTPPTRTACTFPASNSTMPEKRTD